MDADGTILYRQESGEVELLNNLCVYNRQKINKEYTVKIVWDKDCDKSKLPEYVGIEVTEIAKDIADVTLGEGNRSFLIKLNAANNWQRNWNTSEDYSCELKYDNPDGYKSILEINVVNNKTNFTITFSPEKVPGGNDGTQDKPDNNKDNDKDTNKDNNKDTNKDNNKDNNKDKDTNKDNNKDTNKVNDNKIDENKNNTNNTETNNTTGTPDKSTGDNSDLMIWTSVVLLSAIVFIVLLRKKS